jgi:hypothetical protein
MTGMYQDHMLQEMRKTRMALERIAKSLEGIDKALNKKKTVSDYIQVTDDLGGAYMVKNVPLKAKPIFPNHNDKLDSISFSTPEEHNAYLEERAREILKRRGEQNGLIDED